MKHSDKILDFFDKNFNEKKCHDMCRKHKFIQRSTSKLRGDEFIKTMIIPSPGLSSDSLKGLCKRMQSFNPEADLTAQALCERINNVHASNLMRAIFAELLLKVNQRIVSLQITPILDKFNRVIIEDSSVATLNEQLEDVYTGTNRGGNGVKSQVKIDLIHDLSKGVMIDAQLFRGNEPDQGLADRVLKFIEKGDLLLRDLGYFKIAVFKAIDVAGAYFLTRFMPRVHFYLQEEDTTALDIGKYLSHKSRHMLNIIDINGFLGQEKIPIRLIIYRQPQEVTAKRLREANKNQRKKGENMSASKKLLLHFSMFVTNIPEELLSAELIGTVYRLRWEIELVFKRWKSQLEIDHLKGIHRERIDCLIWSRLCTVLIVEFITVVFNKIIEGLYDVELSFVKLIQYLMRSNKFCEAVIKNGLERFIAEMKQDTPKMLLKDKRTSKTMRERVIYEECYYEMQTTEVQKVA
jgi:hypothetical protein